MATLIFWLVFLMGVAAFAAQVWRRLQIIAAAPNTFSVDQLGFRVTRFVTDVVLQRQTIKERPVAGLMHAFVFWGFIAFGGYTTIEFIRGLGIANLTATPWFYGYRVALAPFAVAAFVRDVHPLIPPAFVRPGGLRPHPS